MWQNYKFSVSWQQRSNNETAIMAYDKAAHIFQKPRSASAFYRTEGWHVASSILRTRKYVEPQYKFFFARAIWSPGFVHLGLRNDRNVYCKPYDDRPKTRLWYGPLLSRNKDNCRTEFEHKTSTSETPWPPVSALKASLYLDTLLSLLGSLDLHDAVRNKYMKVRLSYMKRESSVDMTR